MSKHMRIVVSQVITKPEAQIQLTALIATGPTAQASLRAAWCSCTLSPCPEHITQVVLSAGKAVL